MPGKSVNLARHLTAQIESGRYKVGQRIPTEAQLQQRFDVSRHTVREALRDLKGQGLLLARAGIGTVVRARAPRARFMQGVGTLQELIQFVEATRLRLVRRRVLLVGDDEAAPSPGFRPGQEWHEATVLRFPAQGSVPMASMRIFVRPEHADVLALIDAARQPVFGLIERRHGVRIAEVRQQVVAVALDASEARALRTRAGSPALHICRQYYDRQDRMVMASAGYYPSDRFSHNTSFRIEHAEKEES